MPNSLNKRISIIRHDLYLKLLSIVALTTIFVSAFCPVAHAGGIALGATRVIYTQGNKQASLPIINSNENNTYLIQSWVAKENGQKSSDFIVTPPLFVLKSKKENILRIMYVGAELPTDKESVFYLNSKAIPSIDKDKMSGNNLQIATQSIIKVFIRPKNLPSKSTEAPSTIRCQATDGTIKVQNPSPYYVTLVNFKIGESAIKNTMVAPKNELDVKVPNGAKGTIKFQTINDFGGNTATQTCKS